jgi:hypothetical protein
MSKTPVSATAVRVWAKDNLNKVDEAGHRSINGRGRIHPTVAVAFNRYHSKKVYTEGTKDAKVITVSVPNGRGSFKKVSITAQEVRDAYPETKGKRGRLNKEFMLNVAKAKA